MIRWVIQGPSPEVGSIRIRSAYINPPKTTTMAGVVPTDDELTAAVRSLKASSPELGVPKLLAALLASQTTWSVSEKRLRKVIQRLKSEAGTNEYPISSLNPALDVSKFTDKVQPVFFGPEKGKGLVAAQDIEAGQVLWREDPFVYAPPW